MSRMDNIQTVKFLPEDYDITDATHVTRMNSIASLEKIIINFSTHTTHYATLLMTEFFFNYFFTVILSITDNQLSNVYESFL